MASLGDIEKMTKIILSLASRDMQSFIAVMETFRLIKPVLRSKTEARVLDSNDSVLDSNDSVLNTVCFDKEEVEVVSLDDFGAVIKWLDGYLKRQTFLAKDVTQNTLNNLFRSKVGRERIKDMLKSAALANKDKFRGRSRDEFFNILDVEFK